MNDKISFEKYLELIFNNKIFILIILQFLFYLQIVMKEFLS